MKNRINEGCRRLMLSAAALLFMTAPGVVRTAYAQAHEYPNRPVKLIVPFVAGGGTDIAARLVAQKLSGVWGQSVVVDNRGGAGGNIGTGVAAKAAPDGYTLLVASGSIFTVNPHLYRALPFDEKRDFAPITKLVSGPHVLIVNTNFPAKNLKEFIALLKSKPGKFNFASAGVGSQTHMAAEQFLYAAGLEATHVPYKGEGGIYPDLISGQVQFALGNISVVSGHLSSGHLRAIAVTSANRSSILPNVPTMAESGLEGFENLAWFGLMAPAKTPASIIQKVYRDTARILRDPEVKARFQQMGVNTVGNSPAGFADEIERESELWRKIIAARHLVVN